MVDDCRQTHRILNVQHIQTPLVPLHAKLCEIALFTHDHAACKVCSTNPWGCPKVRNDIQRLLDRGELVVEKKCDDICAATTEGPVEIFFDSRRSANSSLVICPSGPIPYVSEKAIPYKYNATMIEDGREVPIPPLPSVGNIAEDSRVLRSGRVIPTAFSARTSDPITEVAPAKNVNQSSGATGDSDLEEILKIIKKSDYKVVDQLMQTPSKISILSLLINSDAHKEALMKVLEQAFVEHDVTVGQFEGIVGNITACNNLSFSEEELPAEGRNHNLALHISVNCKTDALSNVLIDTGSSLNVMAKTTYDQLSYKGSPLRRSGVMVKAFDGSRKNVLGEVDLPITIGPHVFQITFQIMDIQPSYSCLLGRPWIHEAGAVTSTLHQKLKFVKNGKLMTVNGEGALLVSHLSSFSFIGADNAEGTPFQGLVMQEDNTRRSGASMTSLKDAQKVIQAGGSTNWGKLLELPENKHREGLGFSPSTEVSKTKTAFEPIGGTFYSSGFIHALSEANAVSEDNPGEMPQSFVTPGRVSHNWVTKDVPFIAHVSK